MNKKYFNFPKGKVNEGEEGHLCAVREVWEEIGLDIRELVHPENYIQYSVKKEYKTMYVVVGVNEHYQFKPNNTTRNEIGTIVWKTIKEYESRRNEEKFYLIKHFLDPILMFIEHYKRKFRTVRKSSMANQTPKIDSETRVIKIAGVEELFMSHNKDENELSPKSDSPKLQDDAIVVDILESQDEGIIITAKSRGSMASCPDASGGEQEKESAMDSPIKKDSISIRDDINERLDKRIRMFGEELEKVSIKYCAEFSAICQKNIPPAQALGPNPFKEPLDLLPLFK